VAGRKRTRSPSAPMRQNAAQFKWTASRVEAAQLIAEDRLNDDGIAAKVGVHRATLVRWKAEPVFSARVAEIVASLEKAILQQGIARKARRVQAQNDRWKRMQQVIDERASAPEMQTVAGGKAGLMVRILKSIGAGLAAHEVEEFAVDTALLKELRELEKLAALELGQLTNKHDVSVTAPIPYIEVPGSDADGDDSRAGYSGVEG
jgi:predicted DNA-binding protein (UPF0251 family)